MSKSETSLQLEQIASFSYTQRCQLPAFRRKFLRVWSGLRIEMTQEACGTHRTQVKRDNVAKLKVAWVYYTGDISDGTKYSRKLEFESAPIFVDGTLFLTTAFNRVVALDPVSGRGALDL